MSQEIWGSINPTSTSGSALVTLLTSFKDALMSGCAGTARPPNLQAGGIWIDTTNAAAPAYEWTLKFYDGSADVSVFTISTLNNIGGTLTADSEFDIKELKADTTGAILSLIKNRVLSNGQVLSGDVVAEIRWVGKTDTGSSPTLGYLRYTAAEDETTTAFGGTLSLACAPATSTVVSEHLRFIGGLVETVVPYKLNSLQAVSQNVATTASIAALNASTVIAEMTGGTATDIQGVDATGASQVITIHNRSTAAVTLKHQNVSATSTNRLKLPKSQDFIIMPDASATLYYCSTDTRWKLKSVARKLFRTIDSLSGLNGTWTCPAGVTVANIVPIQRCGSLLPGRNQAFLDPFGNIYTWGYNFNNTLPIQGTGDNVTHSSPVAVLGGLSFQPIWPPENNDTDLHVSGGIRMNNGSAWSWAQDILNAGTNGDGSSTDKVSSPVAVIGGLNFTSYKQTGQSSWALTPDYRLYAWGYNGTGELGVGDSVARSSPVAVLGGLSFYRFYSSLSYVSTFGLAKDGTAYAWGWNPAGNLGVGDTTNRSSPVAILGALKFNNIYYGSDDGSNPSVFGITSDGTLYGWGNNTKGQLGVGDVVSRSSPVAVLGGLKFTDVATTRGSVFAKAIDGTWYAWGYNANAQLGVGNSVSRSSPVAVLGGLSFSKIRNAYLSTYGLMADGTLYAWGFNARGELGLGDVAQRSSPVAVLGSIKFEQFVVCQEPQNGLGAMPLGLSSDGIIYSWGSNTSGRIGVGDVVDRSSPVAVLGGFSAQTMAPKTRIPISVTPGTTYNVLLSHGASYFGGTSIGNDIGSITIEYDK